MLQKFLDQLADKIAEKVADNKVEVYEKQIAQLPQQIINDLNPFKAH